VNGRVSFFQVLYSSARIFSRVAGCIFAAERVPPLGRFDFVGPYVPPSSAMIGVFLCAVAADLIDIRSFQLVLTSESEIFAGCRKCIKKG
jgi:hypothetical protein